ncbi:MAG: dihydropteroate synthase [Nitrospiria bacterium]
MRGIISEDEKAPSQEGAFSSFTPRKASGRWHCGQYRLNYGKRPLIMGILNVTPDSFSDGGLFLSRSKALDRAVQMEEEGVDIIDIGGESTRPGSSPVSFEEECRRVLPIIEALSGKLRIPLSIDTTKAALVKCALEAGISIINDVSGFTRDPEMFPVAAESRAGLVIMHTKGKPRTMQNRPRYRHLISEIFGFLNGQVKKASAYRILRNRIAIDPGIGFGKTVKHNLEIIHHLDSFSALGLPILVGPSRKSFIGEILNLPPSERLEGTAAAAAISVFQGAHILRVHDISTMVRVVRIADAIRKERKT